MDHLEGSYTTEQLIDEIRRRFPGGTKVHCAVVVAGRNRHELTMVSDETVTKTTPDLVRAKPVDGYREVPRRDLGDEGL